MFELKDGAGFYGERFVAQVGDALALIAEMPHTWPMWPGRTDVHRRVLKEVPYAIVYAIDRAAIFVVAVEHTKRRPGTGLAGFDTTYWRLMRPASRQRSAAPSVTSKNPPWC